MQKNNYFNLKDTTFKLNKDPNFVPFRVSPKIFRVSRSKSPPTNSQKNNRSPIQEISKNKLKRTNEQNYKTTTDFFSKLYLENKKLSNTYSENFKNQNKNDIKDIFSFVLPENKFKNPNRVDSKAEIEIFADLILERTKKISLISSSLGDNCFEIMDLMENQKKFEHDSKEFIKSMKFHEFLDIQEKTMGKLMKVFSEVIIEKILLKEAEGFHEIGVFICQLMKKVQENFKEYFSKYEEMFSNMKLLQEKELKIENKFNEGLYFLIDYYNLFYHENRIFGDTKPSIETYIYSIQHFKRELKKDPHNQKAFQLYDDLETVLQRLFDKVNELKDDLKNKEAESHKLASLYEEKIKNHKDDQMASLNEKRKESLSESTNAKVPIKAEVVLMSQTLEDSYKKLLKSKEEDRQELLGLNSKLSSKCKKYKEKILKMTTDLTTLRTKKVKESCDKNIECNFYKENFTEKATVHLKNLLIHPSENIVTAFKQSREWTSALITLLLNEKTIADFQDEADKRPRESLQSYIITWFLRRFGNKNLAETFLKDFLLSLRTLASKSERFRIFSELSNIDWNNSTTDYINLLSTLNKFNKNIVRARFMGLNETYKIYMKIIFSLQNYTELKYKEKSLIYPFLPNVFLKGQDLLPIEIARGILENILIEEGFIEEKIKEAMIQLKSLILISDEAYSLEDETNSEKYHVNNNNEKDQFIRFDYFSRFVLDFVVENRLLEIENLYMALKLKNTTKSEGLITFDDFATALAQIYPKKSLRWMECSYNCLIEGVKSEATPLNLSLRGFLPFIYNENSMCENYSKSKNVFLGSSFNTYINYVTLSFHENYEIDTEENQTQLSSSHFVGKKKLAKLESGTSLSLKKRQSAAVSNIKSSGLKKQKTIDNLKNNAVGPNSLTSYNDYVAGMFDSISSLSLLEETYKIIKHIIIQSERNNSNLMALHEEFKIEMTKIPTNICKLRSYEIFNNYDKKDLMYLAESNWKRFRTLLYVCFNF